MLNLPVLLSRLTGWAANHPRQCYWIYSVPLWWLHKIGSGCWGLFNVDTWSTWSILKSKESVPTWAHCHHCHRGSQPVEESSHVKPWLRVATAWGTHHLPSLPSLPSYGSNTGVAAEYYVLSENRAPLTLLVWVNCMVSEHIWVNYHISLSWRVRP